MGTGGWVSGAHWHVAPEQVVNKRHSICGIYGMSALGLLEIFPSQNLFPIRPQVIGCLLLRVTPSPGKPSGTLKPFWAGPPSEKKRRTHTANGSKSALSWRATHPPRVTRLPFWRPTLGAFGIWLTRWTKHALEEPRIQYICIQRYVSNIGVETG